MSRAEPTPVNQCSSTNQLSLL